MKDKLYTFFVGAVMVLLTLGAGWGSLILLGRLMTALNLY